MATNSIKTVRIPIALLRIIPAQISAAKTVGPSRATELPAIVSLTTAQAAIAAQNLLTYVHCNIADMFWDRQLSAAAEYFDEDKRRVVKTLAEQDRYDINALVEDSSLPYHFQSLHEAHHWVLKTLGFTIGGEDASKVAGSILDRERRAYDVFRQQIPEREPFALVHLGIIWDLNSGQWPWDLFTVYAAITSRIGAKKRPVVIYYDEIRRRASGYARKTDVPASFTPTLTTDKVRTRIAKLESKGLIATFSQRHTRRRHYWFPSRCSETDALHLIAETEKKRHRGGQEDKDRRREIMRELMTR
jgi:hypothetical protein